jgi:prophage antirepressor-like protein
MKDDQSQVALFEQKSIRRVWYEGEWWFSVVDVVAVLTDSADPKQYMKRMRTRDFELDVNWGTICTPVEITGKDGKVRKITCSKAQGLFRIIQSIPSPKAEPFRQWLARVGHERLQEIRDPELAMKRMRKLYARKGYPKDWIDRRIQGIEARQDLTTEWAQRGAKVGLEYAILTDEIMKGAFEMGVKKYKDFKSAGKDNLRDHMTDMELLLTTLAETTTTKLHRKRDSRGFPKLKVDASDGGNVAGKTRKHIEKLMGGPVVTREKFLGEDD